MKGEGRKEGKSYREVEGQLGSLRLDIGEEAGFLVGSELVGQSGGRDGRRGDQ